MAVVRDSKLSIINSQSSNYTRETSKSPKPSGTRVSLALGSADRRIGKSTNTPISRRFHRGPETCYHHHRRTPDPAKLSASVLKNVSTPFYLQVATINVQTYSSYRTSLTHRNMFSYSWIVLHITDPHHTYPLNADEFDPLHTRVRGCQEAKNYKSDRPASWQSSLFVNLFAWHLAARFDNAAGSTPGLFVDDELAWQHGQKSWRFLE